MHPLFIVCHQFKPHKELCYFRDPTKHRCKTSQRFPAKDYVMINAAAFNLKTCFHGYIENDLFIKTTFFQSRQLCNLNME